MPIAIAPLLGGALLKARAANTALQVARVANAVRGRNREASDSNVNQRTTQVDYAGIALRAIRRFAPIDTGRLRRTARAKYRDGILSIRLQPYGLLLNRRGRHRGWITKVYREIRRQVDEDVQFRVKRLTRRR